MVSSMAPLTYIIGPQFNTEKLFSDDIYISKIIVMIINHWYIARSLN
ncbi:Uncharacterised protein [Yersinia mollaretii]|nr:Uncharacterised protein [Yersinia mollaretii]CQJ07485.1 Uncharacterised protein [Yersinia mollaretii]